MAKIITSALTILAAITVIYFTLNEEVIERIVPKTYFYHTVGHKPVVWSLVSPLDRLQSLRSSTSELFQLGEKLPLDVGELPYTRILRTQVAEKLFKLYCTTWSSEFVVVQAPFHHYLSQRRFNRDEGRWIYWNEFQKGFTDKGFVKYESSERMLLPKGACVVITNDTIFIKHSMFSVAIFVGEGQSSMSQTFGSSLGVMMGQNIEQVHEYAFENHELHLEATFSSLSSGNPHMAKYKKWVQQMFDALDAEFNTVKQWENAQRDYVVQQVSPDSNSKQMASPRPLPNP